MVAFELLPRDKKDSSVEVRLTKRESARLAKLALKLGKNKSEAVNMAVIHALGTLESTDPRMWLTVPGEPQVEVEEDAG